MTRSDNQNLQRYRSVASPWQVEFRLAVLGFKMEDMGGIKVLKIIKKMGPRLARAILTGHGSEQAAREGLQFDAFEYLMKSCEFKTLPTIKNAYQFMEETPS